PATQPDHQGPLRTQARAGQGQDERARPLHEEGAGDRLGCVAKRPGLRSGRSLSSLTASYGTSLRAMRPVELVMVGAGNRGHLAYGAFAERNPDQAQFVAVVEPDDARRPRV